jgi:hypothetical protein
MRPCIGVYPEADDKFQTVCPAKIKWRPLLRPRLHSTFKGRPNFETLGYRSPGHFGIRASKLLSCSSPISRNSTQSVALFCGRTEELEEIRPRTIVFGGARSEVLSINSIFVSTVEGVFTFGRGRPDGQTRNEPRLEKRSVSSQCC